MKNKCIKSKMNTLFICFNEMQIQCEVWKQNGGIWMEKKHEISKFEIRTVFI